MSFMSRLGQAESARAVVALVFHVKILWQRWNPQTRAPELPQLLQNNLGPPIVLFDRAVDLDHLILQLADIADVF